MFHRRFDGGLDVNMYHEQLDADEWNVVLDASSGVVVELELVDERKKERKTQSDRSAQAGTKKTGDPL